MSRTCLVGLSVSDMAYAAWAYTIRGGLRGKCYAWGMIKGSYVLMPIIITQMKTIQLDFFSAPTSRNTPPLYPDTAIVLECQS